MKNRAFAWVLLAGLAAASPSPAQLALPTYGLGTPYGRGFSYGGRHLSIGGYIRGGYPLFWGPYGYAGGWSSATIIISPPAIAVRSAAPSVELPSFPQIPPLNERDILAIKPIPGGVKNLPPIRKAVVAAARKENRAAAGSARAAAGRRQEERGSTPNQAREGIIRHGRTRRGDRTIPTSH